MLLGLISDTHDNVRTMRAAMDLLQQRGAQFFIHCGDVCSPDILDHLAGLPSAFVWGNCDWDRQSLEHYARLINVACHGAFADLTLDGKRIAVIHGDDPKLKQRLLTAQEHDYLFQGHTHVRADQRIGKTRLINPGALHRATPKSAALLDLASDELEFLTIA